MELLKVKEDMFQGLSIQDLRALCEQNPSLSGFLQGYLSELHLATVLRQELGADYCTISKIPDRDKVKGDLLVQTQGRTASVEVKSLSRHRYKEEHLLGSYSGVVSLKSTDSREVGNRRTCCLERGTFDILAVCLFPVTGKWEYLFVRNCDLPSSPTFPDRLASQIRIVKDVTPFFHNSFSEVFNKLS